MQDLMGNREEEESDLPEDTIFSENTLRCFRALQCSRHSPCQQLNQQNAQAHVTLAALAPGSPITQLTQTETGHLKAFSLNQWDSSTYHSLHGLGTPVLCIKYMLTIACFYKPLSLGKVNAISLRLVMINTTA